MYNSKIIVIQAKNTLTLIFRGFRAKISKNIIVLFVYRGLHIEDDLVVLERFPDEYFDWIYIDSSHHYMHTVMELEIIKRKIKPDGIICGDDWQPNPEHRHHGVYKAVNEFINTENYSIVYANSENLQWFIKKN